ncbi:MAG TPA: hypothetical protein VF868_01770 [Bacteroidia bacterium]|jgi:uncharacterized protein YfkK (UPF0435 family)
MKSGVSSKGVITIAQGSQRYINMAKELAISLNISNPGLKKAIATDSKDNELQDLYDFVIPTDNDFGIGIIQKLLMFDYSPFEESLFIDADCLVLKNIDFLFDQFRENDVGVIGKKVMSGSLFGFPVESMCQKLNMDFIPTFNGGLYYFKKSKTASDVFGKAKEYLYQYDSLGINRHRGNINEEPLMALAMGFYKQAPLDDKGMGMYTPVGQSGVFKIDVLKGYCEFYKSGLKVTPAIMHFGGGYPEAFHYRREVLKMHLVYKCHFNKTISSTIVNGLYNPAYILYVIGYRLLKRIVKRTPFKLFPLMPMFRFE